MSIRIRRRKCLDLVERFWSALECRCTAIGWQTSQSVLAAFLSWSDAEVVSVKVRMTTNSVSVHHRSSVATKIALFRSLFRGREDVYPRRFESRKTGYAGCRLPARTNGREACVRSRKSGFRRAPIGSSCQSPTRSFANIFPAKMPMVDLWSSAFIRCSKMKRASSWRSISTRQLGKRFFLMPTSRIEGDRA
jgi:hypothetical protein